MAVLPPAYMLLGIVEIAQREELDPAEVARVHFALGERLGLPVLLQRILALPREDRWQTMARAALRDDLHAVHAQLTAQVLRGDLVRRLGPRPDRRLGGAATSVVGRGGGHARGDLRRGGGRPGPDVGRAAGGAGAAVGLTAVSAPSAPGQAGSSPSGSVRTTHECGPCWLRHSSVAPSASRRSRSASLGLGCAPQVEVDAVLDRLRLGHLHEQDPRRPVCSLGVEDRGPGRPDQRSPVGGGVVVRGVALVDHRADEVGVLRLHLPAASTN